MNQAIEILLVEDNPGDAGLIRTYLRAGTTHTVHHVERLAYALEYLENHSINVVLLDLNLPDSSGLATVEQICAIGGEFAVVILTGLEDFSTGEAAVEIGAEDYLNKNVLTEISLRKAISFALHRKANQRRLQHLNRCLEAIRDIGRLITNENSPKTLIEVACQKLVSTRGYECTWIILENEAGQPGSAAFAGDCGLAPELDTSERLSRCCITHQAIDHLKSEDLWFSDDAISRCTNSCPASSHHQDSAVIACKLHYEDETLGIMAAIVSKSSIHGNEEDKLFKEIAQDIAHALHSLYLKQQKTKLIEELQQSKELHEAIAENLPNGFIHVIDRDSRILFSTGSALESLGLTPSLLIGKKLCEIEEDEEVSYEEQLKRVFAGEHIAFEHGHGSDQFLVNAAPLQQDGTQVTTALLLGVNITALKEAEKEAFTLQEQVRQMEKLEAIGRLASGIAHDFNNQLGAITGFSELLLCRLKEPQLIKYATSILKSSLASADLTKDLLNFSHKREAQRIPVDLHDLIHEVVHLLTRSIGKNIDITTALAATRVVTFGDPSRLQNAILNLSINARDAMPTGGSLRISTVSEELQPSSKLLREFNISAGTYIKIEVSDTGTGIPEEVLPHIFESFFTTKGEGRGTGVGLHSVFETVHNHAGAISVQTEVGTGTTFSIYLPQVAASERDIKDVKGELIPGQGRVLIVDDEESMREMTSMSLQLMGYQVDAFEDSVKAIVYYAQHWQLIDLVVLDMEMPILDGPATCVELAQINPDVCCIMVSGRQTSNETMAAIPNENSRFLQKPFTLPALSQNVHDLIIGIQERRLEHHAKPD